MCPVRARTQSALLWHTDNRLRDRDRHGSRPSNTNRVTTRKRRTRHRGFGQECQAGPTTAARRRTETGTKTLQLICARHCAPRRASTAHSPVNETAQAGNDANALNRYSRRVRKASDRNVTSEIDWSARVRPTARPTAGSIVMKRTIGNAWSALSAARKTLAYHPVPTTDSRISAAGAANDTAESGAEVVPCFHTLSTLFIRPAKSQERARVDAQNSYASTEPPSPVAARRRATPLCDRGVEWLPPMIAQGGSGRHGRQRV
jgi:hypothetical protein